VSNVTNDAPLVIGILTHNISIPSDF